MTVNGLIFECCDYHNKFKVVQALWNPKLDVLALASSNGEICLKRFYWKTGWQKKLSSEVLFYSKGDKDLADIKDPGDFAAMCWSPDGSILVVAFESGICHLLDVNDALIFYTLRLENRPTQLKWFEPKIDGLSNELSETKRKQIFCNEKTFNSLDCENLRTKDSENQRDNYKILYGIQTFCHSKVNSILMDSVLVVVGEKDGTFGFDVYMSGMFLIKSVKFDCGLLPPNCEPCLLKVQDMCLLSNKNLQLAISVPLKYGASGKSEFDLVAGFTQPIDESTNRESTYIFEYDLEFGNKQLMSSAALLAARSCHIFHLMTSFRENFHRACADWDNISGQFHTNVFGTLYAKYQEESDGLVADFALDFIAYILSGNYTEAFSQAFFREIKLKDWKPAREFVVKHIPAFLQTINKYLLPIVEILYIHLNSLKGELERFKRNVTCKWGKINVLPCLNRAQKAELAKPVDQVEKSIQAICHLSKRLKNLAMVANKNWAELKYVLQLLSSHPDNEQLKMDIEDDYDGIPKRMDFEILLNFITDALVDPAKKEEFGSWTNFLHYWRAQLAQPRPLNSSKPLICNPHWLEHRRFDKIGPLLGVCCKIPKPEPIKIKIEENMFDCSHATTIDDSIKLCFQTMNDIYLFGLRDLNSNEEEVKCVDFYCLEFCHPEPISKLILSNWTDVENSNKFQKKDEQKKNMEKLIDVKRNLSIIECKSLMLVFRSSTSTLQSYLTVGSYNQNLNKNFITACTPSKILKLASFGQVDQPSELINKLDMETIERLFTNEQFKVLSGEFYGTGSLHLIVSFNVGNSSTSNSAIYVLRSDIFGNLQKLDETALTYASDPILYTSPSSSIAILFERRYEQVKWFELENKSTYLGRKNSEQKENRILMAHSVQKIDIPRHSARGALGRKRKLTATGEENVRPTQSNVEMLDLDQENSENNENNLTNDLDDEEDEEDELTDEQLQNGYMVVELEEIEEPTTPFRFPSPVSDAGSPVLLQIHEFSNTTPPNANNISSPPSRILNIVHFGSPATSTASSPNRMIVDNEGEDEQSRTEDQEDYAIDGRTEDDDDRTEDNIDIVDSLENSRDDEILTEQNRQNLSQPTNDQEEMDDEEIREINAQDDEETREAL